MVYKVSRQTSPPKLDAGWDQPPWKAIPSALIANYMGEKPVHFPTAEVKVTYDELSVYVLFQVADRYVRAVAEAHQGNVWEDSCVEFFFTPGPDVSKGYFNLEMNCGGTMLFHFQPGAGTDRIVLSKKECDKVWRTHSLPRIVDPEIDAPVTWTVAYQIPIDLLKKYSPVTTPTPNAAWRANFYKCGDKTSHPHWLTWAPVDSAKPNFHLPEFFGFLEFE
jgi:hypothetical protein